ncbi:hypothetical protein DE146DRAFT_739006 [Phaeosphaeria sp. MPI-PUGE-AT-0046c]|nr:hypothetical protein DE146DRAFT_739006 [Phaeosphaeria sp. MPI-PUGE-AT-0046c]
MHFLLLGASGRTGQHVVTELLSQGHTAVALVRASSSLKARSGLTLVTGSPLSKSDISKAISATPSSKPTAGIFTLNAPRKSESPFSPPLAPPRFLADSCVNACRALEEEGIRRIVVMSTAGAGDSWSNLPLLSKAFMGWTNVKLALEDHNILDREIRTTSMDWTLIRAVRLEYDDGEGAKKTENVKEVEVLEGDGKGMSMSDSVGTRQVAKFLVKVAIIPLRRNLRVQF